MREIIFVSGIHGCGKSTFCEKLSKKLGFANFSCSDLIRKYKDLSRTNKFISKIQDNQSILKKSIDLCLNVHESYILDGHFTLLDTNSEIKRIPIKTFSDLSITKIILLSTPIDQVYLNLLNRDNNSYSKDLLIKFSEAEFSYCKEVAKKLKLPLEIINPYNN